MSYAKARMHTMPTHRGGDVLAAISDGLVGLLKDFYGKGPTGARTYWQADVIVCIMRGGYTRAEHTLSSSGRGDLVAAQRAEFQVAMEERFADVVERATGCRVLSVMGAGHQPTDTMAHVFVLAPPDPAEAGGLESRRAS